MAKDYRSDSMRNLQIDKTVVLQDGAGATSAMVHEPEYIQDEDDLRDALAVCLCCCTSCSRMTRKDEYSDRFRYELLAGRAFWSGKFVQDYGFHVANQHPLLSCLFSHPANPYTKPQRIAILLIVSAFTFAPTQFILMASGGLKDDTTQATPATTGQFPEHLRMAMQALRTGGANLVILLFVTLPVAFLQLFLESLMVLDVQLTEGIGFARIRCCRPCCRRFADGLEPVKRCCLCGALVLAALTFWAVYTVTRAQRNFAGALAVFLLSRLQSWVLWFPTDFLMPCCGFLHTWFTELREQEEEGPEHEAETEAVSPPWKYEGQTYTEGGLPTNGGAREATQRCRDCQGRECR